MPPGCRMSVPAMSSCRARACTIRPIRPRCTSTSALPETNSVKRIREVAAAMVAHGWQQAPAMGEHFGLKLTKDGVTSTFHENPDDRRFATMHIYGECRNTSDHRNDNPAFTDITDRLR